MESAFGAPNTSATLRSKGFGLARTCALASVSGLALNKRVSIWIAAASRVITATCCAEQVSFNPTAEEQAKGVPVRFGGRADTVVFPHIAVTPTPGWADVTAVREV